MSITGTDVSEVMDSRKDVLVGESSSPRAVAPSHSSSNGAIVSLKADSSDNSAQGGNIEEKAEMPDETQVIVPARTKRKHQGEGM